jgi:Gluconate 2-dehydrogenase subunit 3
MDPRTSDVLRAAVERILPADDFPGAWETGAGEYLARQLAGDLLPQLELVTVGLAALDAEAAERFGARFPALPPADQDAVLHDVERGAVCAAWSIDPRQFFDLLVRTTAEGFYGDPDQGGNRGRVSWAMTGFDRETT